MEQKNHGSPSFINVAALLLFAIVIAVVSVVTTYFILNSRSNQQYSADQSTSVSPPQTYVQPTSPPIETTTVSDETANWKVYRNEKYGYEIKYPLNWELKDLFDDPSMRGIMISSKEEFGGPPEPTVYTITVTHSDVIAVNYKFDKNKYPHTMTTINGLNAYRTTAEPSRSGTDLVYIFRSDSMYVEIRFDPFDENEPFTEQTRFHSTFNQILSTFKFLE